MITEFDRYYQTHKEKLSGTSEDILHDLWEAAQRRAINTIENPPVIPKKGDKILFHSLVHPTAKHTVHEVVAVTEVPRKYYNILIFKREENDNVLFSAGVLGEVEIIEE